MTQLKFSQALVPLVLSGEKYVTWRLFDDKDLSVGDVLRFSCSETGEYFAVAEIVEIQEKSLSEITEEDYVGHEKFKDTTELLSTYQGYYGERVTLETPVKMVRFRLLSDRSIA